MNMANQLKYKEIFAQSINDPDTFWGKAAQDVVWNKKWTRFSTTAKKPFYLWFKGGN